MIVSTHTNDLPILPLQQNASNTIESTDILSDSPLPQGWEHAFGTSISILKQRNPNLIVY